MYGLEKRPSDGFEFDLEKELKDENRRKELMQTTEDGIKGLKEALRDADPKSKEFDNFGTMLHGYTAMQTVIQKIK